MTQPLYTAEDNKELNAKIDSTIKMVAVEVDMTDAPGRGQTSVQTFVPEAELQEQIQYARGENPVFTHIDDAGFVEVPEPTPSVKIQNSSTFGTMNQNTSLTQHNNKVRSFTEGGIEAVHAAANIVDPITGAVPSFNVSPEMIRQAQAQLEAGGAVVMNADGSKQMFSNIKDMFAAKANKPVTQPKTYFVDGKSKFHFGIDKTNLEPSAIVRLSAKSFEAKYLAQLESYLYNNKEDLDPEQLMMFIYLVSYIEQGHFPIKVVSARHRIQLPKIIKTLNVFYNKNWTVLSGIAKMFNAMPAQTPQTSVKE